MLWNIVAQTTSDLYYYTDTTTTDSVSAGALGAIMLLVWIPALIIGVIMIISLWKIFQKAGKPGWAAIVPVYNSWVLLEIVGYPGWWAILSLVPFVNLFPAVMMIIAYYKLAKLFGKSDGFAVCNIFFSYVTMPILAFGNSQFAGTVSAATPAPAAPYSPVPPAAPVAPAVPAATPAPVVPTAPEVPAPVSQPSFEQPDTNSAPTDDSRPQTPPQPPLVQ